MSQKVSVERAIPGDPILSKGIEQTDSTLARLAYHAYGSQTDFKNFQGNPMPEWHDLPENIRKAWCKAASAIENSVRRGDSQIGGNR